MAWFEVTLTISAESWPEAEALLELAGARSISIADSGDSPIFEPDPGTEPLWPTLCIKGLFEEEIDPAAVTGILGTIARSDLLVTPLDTDAILQSNAEPIAPQEIGPRLSIVPPAALDPDDPHQLGLNMGLAFGTGRHPTTRLCLEWIERKLGAGITVLDYGAGSGVLALAALKLGAREVTAIDNEPQALMATAENASLNRIDDGLRIALPEDLGHGSFDLILANILARPLIELAPRFAALQLHGGQIVLSGILVAQVDEVAAGYLPFYEAFERRQLDGWALLTAKRKQGV